MKKVIVLIAVTFICILKAQAQNDTVLYVNQIQDCQTVNICLNKYGRAVICAPEECSEFLWQYTDDFGNLYESNESSIILDGNLSEGYTIEFYPYNNCSQHKLFVVIFMEPNVPAEATTELWKRQFEATVLSVPYYGYSYQWNTGETTRIIEVTEPGTYTCGVSDMCATSVQTFIVQDNVEIDLATCDLESNLNLITWQTNPAQAQYIDHVIVKRDGLQVGTADYSDGQFTDNIGSGSASRTYTLTAVATDGTECPIVSYPKETIHMAYLTGINNTIEVNWNIPTGYDLLGYNICEWHEDDGSLFVIDFVGASVTSYTCSESQFDEGYIVVQGVEAGKDSETRLLSNRSMDLVGLGEHETMAFKVYPNPANGVLFVETRHGTSLPVETYRIMNPIGQTVMQGEITSEKQQIDVHNLPNGVYFITVGGATRKFVVE